MSALRRARSPAPPEAASGPPIRALPSSGRAALRKADKHRVRKLAGGAQCAPVWLFDLDNTLHDCSRGIFGAIDTAMSRAVADTLGLEKAAADEIRHRYWKRYGATVIGMVRHHGARAGDFLERSHNFEIAPLVHSERGLARKLACLPGRKILLTNAPLRYAREVLNTLGILHCFDGLWAIDHMTLQGRMRPKPSAALMRQVLARLGVPARRVILVEDTLRNLRGARQVGMRTVHVFHPGTPFSALYSGRGLYVDARINAIGHLLVGRCGLRIPRSPDHE
ncbi:pyrimidine 5'-nucleotidase [Allopusillimonas ginsengisoli]|uniref:pyrimidine 5'-nucleotidase n=1 Tax=Allopusillimonas ginsengisoli TaxID=453575 RepID=UPI00101F1086|nr:pyrimidine 5'-nucleotidase [Allopusillimonas ginsengisoli]TEA78333.1 pyrimidine 5'-nucleotidase [Allopusillimonas ginsengisoli]